MKRIIRLFPADWRARYEPELEALLMDMPPARGDVLDLAFTALRLRVANMARALSRGLHQDPPRHLSAQTVLLLVAAVALLPGLTLGAMHIFYRVLEVGNLFGGLSTACTLQLWLNGGGLPNLVVAWGVRAAVVIAALVALRPSLALASGGITVALRVKTSWLPLIVMGISIALLMVVGPFPVDVPGIGPREGFEGFACLP